jgi:hypothetical protein
MVRLGVTILLGSGVAFSQLSSTISLSNGIELNVTAKLGQPTGEETLNVEMARASGDSFYRMFRDQNKLVVFAYELFVGSLAGSDGFHVTAKLVGTEFAARFPNADGGKPVPTLSSDHELGPLRSGERAELGLFEIPGMGLKVIDTVQVKLSPGGAPSGQIRFSGLRVSINRTPTAGPQARGQVSGRYAMFYIPARGGYFFSIDPPPGLGFNKAGTVDGNHMQFTVDNETFDCVADAPILLHADRGEIWVLHNPAYKLSGKWTQTIRPGQPAPAPSDEFFTAASDSLSWWLQ